jgi:hypothetical protein
MRVGVENTFLPPIATDENVAMVGHIRCNQQT